MRSCLILAISLLGVATGLRAQSPPILRSETRIVLVDAVVTDKQNRFARDLTAKDFHIREDGKEQKITSFSLERGGLTPERSSRHYIVLFFDTSTLRASTLQNVRQDALRFVDGFASPDRFMAVITFGPDMRILQNFTSDPARLKAALGRVEPSSVIAAAPAAGGGRGGRGGAAPADNSVFRNMLGSLRAVANSVNAIQGRKALVLFSAGGPMTDLTAEITATVDACNRANVAVYGVNSFGLIGALQKSPSKSVLARLRDAAESLTQAASDATVNNFQRGGGRAGGVVDASGAPMNTSAGSPATTGMDVIRALASGTGGVMLGASNNLPDELGRIAQEQDEYYLLGYTPAVESAEGSCHTLQVKVDKSGLDVRARKGYCTSKADSRGEKPAGNDLEARAAGNAQGNIVPGVQLPWFYTGTNAAEVDVAMDFIPAAVEFQKDNGKLHGRFDILGVAYAADGSVASRFSDTVKLDFDSQQQADAFLKTPYHYRNQVEIAPGKYNFRVAISSGQHGFGKIDTPLTIDPWDGQSLTLSGLALSHEAHAATAPVASSDALTDLLPDRVRALVANGTEVVPTGTNRFAATENGFIYFEVYEPPLKPREFAVRVRLLDRASGRQINDSGPMNAGKLVQPGHAVIPMALKLPIAAATLPAGKYQLEVSIDSIVRTANFDVN